MRWIWAAAELVRKLRFHLRFGELSRAPLKFLRLEVRESFAECEWLARASDPWDRDLPAEVREQNHTLQALHDALTIRELLFAVLPEVDHANLKVYRRTTWEEQELIISACVSREDKPPPRIASLAMRAKLCGLRFRLQDGGLGSLNAEVTDG